LIYLFGTISLFQLWVVGFQIKFISKLSAIHKGWIWGTVILFNLAVWTLAAVVASTDILIINRWFNL
jgi:hypothetical protein